MTPPNQFQVCPLGLGEVIVVSCDAHQNLLEFTVWWEPLSLCSRFFLSNMVSGGCAQELASHSEEPRRGQGVSFTAFLVITISPGLCFHLNAKRLLMMEMTEDCFRVDLINRLCSTRAMSLLKFADEAGGGQVPPCSLLSNGGWGRWILRGEEKCCNFTDKISTSREQSHATSLASLRRPLLVDNHIDTTRKDVTMQVETCDKNPPRFWWLKKKTHQKLRFPRATFSPIQCVCVNYGLHETSPEATKWVHF